MLEGLIRNYGYLFEEALLKEIDEVGVYKEIPEGTMLIEIGEEIKMMPLIISGAIKVLREDKEGDELLLYFIEKGDTCAMTLACCIEKARSEIRAETETDSKIIMVPIEKMGEWMGKYESWQNFIIESYHTRMMEMLDAIDSIAFLKMDERLLKYLRDKAMVTHDDMITTTHQEIAQDLHTSRVVVSRLLKKLENEEAIKLYRNKIKILKL